ncbi:MAG TPA: hypothetical protein VE244_12320 [Nitrososphaeraceae archaeon]|jgi:hypothetical protein|nr:hypothetical protein [Nitrososphaeraceae archaeon]
MNILDENQNVLIIGASGTVRSEIVKQQDANAGSLMKQVEVLVTQGKT